ncbi:uncharacterized protein LOC119372202 [Rhipicephalus sanguineus]|uniref:uncharacterized protein LOC119372202 n=1 Tax=Rhipicephalus sanguineus TaxID=34632 RepID=UPI001893F7C2|nr:uncharacterized protein LOC119372202 [Rhipicephalus sanguineus]
MASSSKKGHATSVLTPRYMSLLHSLCKLSCPTESEVSSIFHDEFRSALGGPSPRASAAPLRARGAATSGSKKRGGGKSASRGSGKGRSRKTSKGDDPDGDDDESVDTEPYERACTWKRDETRCWLIGELEPWNRILSRTFFEIREHKWGELTLQGYSTTEINTTTLHDVLRVSLLLHLLVRQHRCLLRIVLDLVTNEIEPEVFWHAIKTCSRQFDYFEYRSNDHHEFGLVPQPVGVLWCHSIAALRNLPTITLFRVFFDKEIVRVLGRYVQRSTSLTKLVIKAVTADSDDAVRFLDQLARNTTLKTLIVGYSMIKDRAGEALAKVVLNHVALETLEISASNDVNPSPILRASVQSPCLKSLSVNECIIELADIHYMVRALSRPAPIRPPEGGKKPRSESPIDGLQKLAFFHCLCNDPVLDKVYASLIGGVLRHLTFTACNLTDAFASGAVFQLRKDRRLRHLYVQHNSLSTAGYRILLKVLRRNTTVEELSINITNQPDVSSLFEVIQLRNLDTRVIFGWINPSGTAFAEGHNLCKLASASLDLDNRSIEDATILLDTLVSYRQINALTMVCTHVADQEVIDKMIDSLGKTKYLRQLHLNIILKDTSVVAVFRALEVNCSIEMLFLNYIIFEKKTIKALGELIEHNKTINFLSIDLENSGDQNWNQLRSICYRLKEVVPRNRYLISVNVVFAGDNRAGDYQIKEALRRNIALVHNAIQFINGSMTKSDALAFETLRKSYSVRLVMQDQFGVAESDARLKIDAALDRLYQNYFILTNVVKHGLSCSQDGSTIASLPERAMGRLCSFLSLTDVVDF